jgi:hypothetical protein
MDAEQRADDAAQVADMVERRVAAALTGDVLESLSQRIAAEWEHYASGLHVTLGELAGHLERAAVSPWLPLERAPSWWSDLRGHSNTQLALVVADYCLAPRKHGAPSVMHVALEIGRFLGVKGGSGGWGHNPRGATFLAGYRLLELAVEAGFLSAETITTKRYAQGMGYLTHRFIFDHTRRSSAAREPPCRRHVPCEPAAGKGTCAARHYPPQPPKPKRCTLADRR